MTMNADQATQASMFLTAYAEAISTLHQTALREKETQTIEMFLTRINNVYNNKIFRRLCDPKDPLLNSNNSAAYMGLVKDVRAFQYSHYAYLKYLPEFMNIGNGQDLKNYMNMKIEQLRKYVNS